MDSEIEKIRPLVTQNNLYMLLPAKVANIVEMLSRRTNTPELRLLKEFYRSNTYKAMEREETKYWQWGNVALCENFLEEVSKNK